MVITVGKNFNNLEVSTVTISPFLLKQNISKLTIAINNKKSELKKKSFKELLSDFVPLKNFCYVDSIQDRKGVFRYITKEFKKAGIVTECFEQELEQRESMSSTAFGRVALPHSIKMDARESSGYIYINPKGIKWSGGTTVYLVIALAISAEDKGIFRKVFDTLSSIITNPINISKLIESKTYEELI